MWVAGFVEDGTQVASAGTIRRLKVDVVHYMANNDGVDDPASNFRPTQTQDSTFPSVGANYCGIAGTLAMKGISRR
jgi:hypothetical protein